MKVHLSSQVKFAGEIPHQFDVDTIKNEPMFFSCDQAYALEHGGPITKAFFGALPPDWKEDDIVFDSRVHMLMPGWFPCIPGWHLDDVPRTRPDGQPDHVHPMYKSEHICAIVGDASKTQFALGDCELDEPGEGHIIYGEWHPEIDRLIRRAELKEFDITPGVLYAFDWQSIHRGTAATKNGWRWFGRISRKTERKVFNEIRRQTQVYLSEPNGGW